MNQMPLNVDNSIHYPEICSYLVSVIGMNERCAADWIEGHMPELLDREFIQNPVTVLDIEEVDE